ncbi:hypothetical protein ACP4OV_028132 [Aristida adscensionis]
MEIVLSAFLGEITQRSISFLIERFSREASSASPSSDENLHRKLLRVRIIVEEAESRQIRNFAMLEQLKVLRAGMYRGYYMLDNYKYQAYKNYDHGVSHSFALSKFNPAKRMQLCGGSSNRGQNEMQQMTDYLHMIIMDASEFLKVLEGCPPLYRRPYSTYLVLEKCMFARHVEMEHIINFLMQKGSPETEDFDVMPIVGPAKAGKSTLIEHLCNDERVRTAFSLIVFLTEGDLCERLTFIGDGGTIKHRSYGLDTNGRVLIIIRVNGDISEDIWTSILLASKRYAANDSKIIICSRSGKIARFGTTSILKVEYLTPQAYWYFFKTLAFGSTDPKEDPELASMAMEIAMGLNSSFIAGNAMTRILRANFNAQFWRTVQSCVKELNQGSCSIFGSQPVGPPGQNSRHLRILNDSNEYCSVFNYYQIVSSHDEAPLTTFQEVWLGSAAPDGKFDVLAWVSSIPPFYSYTCSCEIHKVPKSDIQKRHILKSHH